MAKIDKDVALQLMQSGASDSEIAARFGVSRQAVNLLRQSFVRGGMLAGQMAVGTSSSVEQERAPAGPVEQAAGPQVSGQDAAQPTFDQITDWMIRVIKEAGEARRLREEHEAAAAEIEALQAELRKLEEEMRQVSEQLAIATAKSKEYEAAVNTAEIRPITLDGPNPSTWQRTG